MDGWMDGWMMVWKLLLLLMLLLLLLLLQLIALHRHAPVLAAHHREPPALLPA